MGIIGSYTAIENSMLDQILNGEESDTGFEKCQYMDIDKSWQLIHFLLCKNTENGKPPMGYVVPIFLSGSGKKVFSTNGRKRICNHLQCLLRMVAIL